MLVFNGIYQPNPLYQFFGFEFITLIIEWLIAVVVLRNEDITELRIVLMVVVMNIASALFSIPIWLIIYKV